MGTDDEAAERLAAVLGQRRARAGGRRRADPAGSPEGTPRPGRADPAHAARRLSWGGCSTPIRPTWRAAAWNTPGRPQPAWVPRSCSKGSTTVIAAPDGRAAASQGGAGADGREAGLAELGAEAVGGRPARAMAARMSSPCGSISPAPHGWPPRYGRVCCPGGRGSLLAQGLEVGEAAAAAAYLHGLAARLAAAGAGSRPVPAVEPSGDGWDLSNPEESRAGYPEAPIAAAGWWSVRCPTSIRSARRRTG